MPCEAPLVEVLASLDAYNASHTKASSNFKSAMWNLSKARRQKGGLGVGFSYNASDVREELRAHAFLEKSPEPSLTEEDANGDDDLAKSCSGENGPFVLRFRGRDLKRITQKNDNLPTNSSSDTGLRQRKGKYTDCKKIEWSEETYQDKEEEKLRKTDPIELFGALPPRELKTAQKHAKEMLEYYITTANKAEKILRLINTK